MAFKQRVKWSISALSTAYERRRHPEKFIQVNKTPWQEIYRDGIMSVRHYSLPEGNTIQIGDKALPVTTQKHRTPLLLVTALGIHSWTFDIMPSRSMVRYLMARGFDVFVIDWGSPSQSNRHLSLATYVNQWMPLAVEAVRRHTDAQQINMVGYCMGGLLSLMYLGSHPNAPVKAISTIASPINFHRGGTLGLLASLISKPALKINELFRVTLDPFDSRLFHIPGKLVSVGFKLTNPPGVVKSYLDLVRNITDREFVIGHMTMGQWFNDMVDYPGNTVREVIAKMIISNNLAKDAIIIGDRQVEFAKIKQDLLAIAGETDNICTLGAARDALRIVGSKEKRFEVVPGGHAGVFAGSTAPDTTWRLIADWLEPRSA